MGGFFLVADYQSALGDSRRPCGPSASRLHHIGGKRCYLAFTQLRAVCGHSTDSLRNRALYLSETGAELVEVGAHDTAGIGIGEAVAHTAARLRPLEK